MKRPLRPEEARLWHAVTATVRLASGRVRPAPPPEEAPPAPAAAPVAMPILTGARAKPRPKAPQPPDIIEPSRKRRIARGRDPIDARLDLHGYGQDQARAAIHRFVDQAHAQGARAVLIITGKGVYGDGVLRRRVPEWLAEPPSREWVAGISQADRHHGGEGALYVALKRVGR